MKRHIVNILTLFIGSLLGSCVSQYHVDGMTDRSTLEGQMLYVKMFHKDEMVTIDSCMVRHGQLSFSGELDSAKFVVIYSDEKYVGPLVLEEGEISLSLNELQNEIKGGPLNDSLNVFINQFQRYYNSRMILEDDFQRFQKQNAQYILDGMAEHEREKIYSQRMNELNSQMLELESLQDAFETNFIVRNSNNILGPGVFMLLTWKYPYPYLTPQIEEILFRSSATLKTHPFVQRYIEAAQKNMEQMRE